MRRGAMRVLAGLCAVAITAFVAGPAAAHETREAGPVTLTIGFLDEPAYATFKNAVQVGLKRNGKPVTDVQNGALQVMVMKAQGAGMAQTGFMPLERNFGPDWGTPGEYVHNFVPSQPGAYEFHVKGKIGSQVINELVKSGPNTFSPVENAADVTFPATAEPSAVEMGARMSRQADRTNTAMTDLQDEVASLRTLVYILCVIVGIMLGVDIFQTLRARRKRDQARAMEAPAV